MRKLNIKSRFDVISDFREARKRKYPIREIPGFPQGRLAIVPKRVIGKDKRDNRQGLADFTDAGIIKNEKRIPKIFLIRLAKEVKNPKLKRELIAHELAHYKFKKFMLKDKLEKDRGIKNILKKNPSFKRGENNFEEAVVQTLAQAKTDILFRNQLRIKHPTLFKKLRGYI